jgi:hypothetical protein
MTQPEGLEKVRTVCTEKKVMALIVYSALRKRNLAMSKYRKKPVVVEAELYRPGLEDGHVCLETSESLLAMEWRKAGAKTWMQPTGLGHKAPLTEVPYINTLEGRHYISPSDYIITGVKGERYPCKPDIFAAIYEPVEEPSHD